MTHLTRQDLFNLEKYAEIRNEFRSQVMAHKKIGASLSMTMLSFILKTV